MKRFLSLVLLLLAVPQVAGAQDLTPEEIEAYREAAGAAAEAYAAGEYRDAVEKLDEARAIYDHPDLTYNLGRSYQNMGWCARARQQYQEYVKRDDVGKDDKLKVGEQLQTLSSCVESRQLAIECEPQELDVSIEPRQDEAAACGATLTITPGRYTLTAGREGFADDVRTISVTTESDDFSIVMSPEVAHSLSEPLVSDSTETDDSDWRPITGWSMVGAGALMIVTGLVIDATSSRTDDLESAGSTSSIGSIESDASSQRGLIIGLYVGGAVVAAGGAGILTWHMLDTSDSESDVELAISPTIDGVVFHGTF